MNPIWNRVTLTLALGLVFYLVGTAVFAIRWAFYGQWIPADWHLYEASVVAKDIGVVFVILGLVLYLMDKGKKI